eukprot:942368-Rhodomonas_salina.1
MVRARVFQQTTLNARAEEYCARRNVDPGQRIFACPIDWFLVQLFKTNFHGGAIYNLYVLGSGPHFGDSLPTRCPDLTDAYLCHEHRASLPKLWWECNSAAHADPHTDRYKRHKPVQ